MAELVWLTPRAAYLPGVVNLGLLTGTEGRAVAIDTGLDGEAARKLKKAAEAAGYKITAIINTHSHADHCGGNRWLQDRTGASVFTSPLERGFVEHPVLEPSFLFSGAAPPPALRNRFLLAQPSLVADSLREGLVPQQLKELAGVEAEVLGLAGHTLGQMGVLCNGVLYAGDAFLSPAVIDKHRIPFFVDPAGAAATLERLAARSEVLLPGHGEPTQDGTVLEYNRSTLLRIREAVSGLLDEPGTEEQVVARLASHLDLDFPNEGQYYLIKTAVNGYLTWLADEGSLASRVTRQGVKWERVSKK